jgi:hypothetical protein
MGGDKIHRTKSSKRRACKKGRAYLLIGITSD